MTENKAIEFLRGKYPSWGCDEDEYENAQIAIQALEEVLQYRAIGTVEEIQQKDEVIATQRDIIEGVYKDYEKYLKIGTIEEFKALKEKSAAKKPFQPFGTHSYKCSNCWQFVAHEVDDNCDLSSLAEWCPYCGSRIDWSE